MVGIGTVKTKLNFEHVNEEHGENDKDELVGTKVRHQKFAWSREDSKKLIHAHTKVNEDTYVRMNQCSNTFWNKVTECCNILYGPSRERNINQCKNHFNKVSKECQKFSGAYNQALRNKQSGQSDTDVMSVAHDIYLVNNGKKFTMEHVWEILSNELKWRPKRHDQPSRSTSSGANSDRVYADGANSNTSLNSCTPTSVTPSTDSIAHPLVRQQKEKCGIVNDTMNMVIAASHSHNDLSHKIQLYSRLVEKRMKVNACLIKVKEENMMLKKWSQFEKLLALKNRTSQQEMLFGQLSAELWSEDDE